jgi:hypothetical protein
MGVDAAPERRGFRVAGLVDLLRHTAQCRKEPVPSNGTAKIAESLEDEISMEPEWLGEHVSVLAEDRVQVDPALWAQAAGFLERRETFRADYQTFAGKVSAYELGPLHLLAYQWL